MLKSVQRWYQSHAFKEESFGLLNHITLHIRDKEIEQEYKKHRIDRMNELFLPCGVMVALFILGASINPIVNRE